MEPSWLSMMSQIESFKMKHYTPLYENEQFESIIIQWKLLGKHWKSWFWPANVMQSTHLLVKIYHRCCLWMSLTELYKLPCFLKKCIKIWLCIFRFSSKIPVTFMIGFYVANVVSRYWDQFISLPWPDRIAYKLVAFIPGQVKLRFSYLKSQPRLWAVTSFFMQFGNW